MNSFQSAAELGEYDPKEHTQGYVSEFRFIPNQVGPNVIMMLCNGKRTEWSKIQGIIRRVISNQPST